jgi:hypothetical protein
MGEEKAKAAIDASRNGSADCAIMAPCSAAVNRRNDNTAAVTMKMTKLTRSSTLRSLILSTICRHICLHASFTSPGNARDYVCFPFATWQLVRDWLDYPGRRLLTLWRFPTTSAASHADGPRVEVVGTASVVTIITADHLINNGLRGAL